MSPCPATTDRPTTTGSSSSRWRAEGQPGGRVGLLEPDAAVPRPRPDPARRRLRLGPGRAGPAAFVRARFHGRPPVNAPGRAGPAAAPAPALPASVRTPE